MSERNLNFDEITERRGTHCLKYDFAVRRGMPEDVLPLWVADMDFKTSSYVEDAVIERIKKSLIIILNFLSTVSNPDIKTHTPIVTL